VARTIKEHFNDENSRFKKLTFRLIGVQAISLARLSFRLVDALIIQEKSEIEKVKRIALSKLCQALRNIGSLINRVDISNQGTYVSDVKEVCTRYFNLFSLFFFKNLVTALSGPLVMLFHTMPNVYTRNSKLDMELSPCKVKRPKTQP